MKELKEKLSWKFRLFTFTLLLTIEHIYSFTSAIKQKKSPEEFKKNKYASQQCLELSENSKQRQAGGRAREEDTIKRDFSIDSHDTATFCHDIEKPFA